MIEHLYADIGYRSLCKNGEFVCGDHIERLERPDGTIVLVLADGLGSKKGMKIPGKILAVLFSIFTLLASFGIGAMGQVNKIVVNIESAFSIPALSNVQLYDGVSLYALIIGLLLAVFVTYRKPREYKMAAVDTSANDAIKSDKLGYPHIVTLVAIVAVVVVESIIGLLALSATVGLLIMFVGGAIKRNEIDDQFAGGVKIMGLIAIIMLVAGGYAEVMKATNAVDALVQAALALMAGNKIIAATVITLIGLLVTMGIGSSFSTVPVLVAYFVVQKYFKKGVMIGSVKG